MSWEDQKIGKPKQSFLLFMFFWRAASQYSTVLLIGAVVFGGCYQSTVVGVS